MPKKKEEPKTTYDSARTQTARQIQRNRNNVLSQLAPLNNPELNQMYTKLFDDVLEKHNVLRVERQKTSKRNIKKDLKPGGPGYYATMEDWNKLVGEQEASKKSKAKPSAPKGLEGISKANKTKKAVKAMKKVAKKSTAIVQVPRRKPYFTYKNPNAGKTTLF
jgi:hypothetical protein